MRCLGKLAPKIDRRTLRYEQIVPVIPPPPPAADWTLPVKGVTTDFGNNDAGDCTIAGFFNLVTVWTANAANIIVPTTAEAITAYQTLTLKANGIAYDPNAKPDANGNNPTDTGLVGLDVLNYARNTGIAGHKILAYVAINPKNREQVKSGIDLLGGVYFGVAMPDSWRKQVDNSLPWQWSVNDKPNPRNGHMLGASRYDENWIVPKTWGREQPTSWEWFTNCCDECYAILTLMWINGPDSPSALDMPALQKALNAL